MALLLLQDCLIDLSNINKSVAISLSEKLVNTIINNDTFDENELNELINTLSNLILSFDDNSVTIFISSIFYQIPFFEDKLREKTKCEIFTIFDFLKDFCKNTDIEIVEIGNYFNFTVTYDCNKNNIIASKIDKYNLDNEIYDIIRDNVKNPFTFSSIENINLLNSKLPKDIFVTTSDLEYSQMATHFDCFYTNTQSVSQFYTCISKLLSGFSGMVLNQLSLMYLFENQKLIKLKNQSNFIKTQKNITQFSIELYPSDIYFENETIFNLWQESDKTLIKVKRKEISQDLKINSKQIKSHNICLHDLNLSKIILKVDELNNISCRISDLKNNSSIIQKIKFN